MAQVKRRPYRSKTRADRAQATRRRIVAAASRLFVERGYAATAVDDIASEAGVTSRTVYLAFPTKRTLLDEAIGIAIGGDDARVLVRDRIWFWETVEAPGPEVPALFARFTAALHVRSAALLEAAEAGAAADPELALRRERGHENRRADMRRVAQAIALTTGVDAGYATDMLYTLGSSAVYSLLVFQCGWTPHRYERWLAAVLEATLLERSGA